MSAHPPAAGPLSGLPDPDLDRPLLCRGSAAPLRGLADRPSGHRACRRAAGASSSASPTLGFGFALFGFIIAAVGFVYRTSLLAAPASATLGMRFVGIEFRRGNGERFDFFTALVHTAIYAVCIGTFVLQLLSCLTILGTRYRQSLRRPRPRHHGDQPPGGLSATV